MKRSTFTPLLILTICISMPIHAYDFGDVGAECENTLMNDIHSEVIYDLSGSIVEINNEIIQSEIAKLNTVSPPKEELIESIDSITEFSNELSEQKEAFIESHPNKSFFQRAKDHLDSTSKTLIAFSKKAFSITKEKSIVAGTFIAQESKKAFSFLKNKMNFLLGKVEDKKVEIKQKKIDLTNEYSQFELAQDSFSTNDRVYTSKILRDQSIQELMTSRDQSEKVLIYKFEDDRVYHLGSNGDKSRLHLLTLRTITLKDLSQITIESNFIKNEQVKNQIINEKKQLEYSLDRVNRKLLTAPSSAEYLIAAHRIGQAIVDLKIKMKELKNQDPLTERLADNSISRKHTKLDEDEVIDETIIRNVLDDQKMQLDNQFVINRRRIKKGHKEIKTKDGEVIKVFDVEL